MSDSKKKVRLQHILDERKINHIQLAEMIGISPQAVGKICNHKTAPSLKTLNSIAEKLEIEIHELFELSSGFDHIYDEKGNWKGILPNCK